MESWHLLESPGEYTFGDVPTPEPGPDDVRVRMVASALNHIDHWLTSGRPAPPSFPHVPGSDGAGVVDRVGSSVTSVSVGDEVVCNVAVTSAGSLEELGIDSVLDPSLQLLGEHRWGSHGPYVVLPARNVIARPPNRSWEECAAYSCATSTAWRMLRRARFDPSATVLITGIGGGVATAALNLVTHFGAEAYVTSRDPEKRRRAAELGASGSFDSSEPYPVKVDIIVDSIGPAVWPSSLAALKPGGRFVTCGATSGPELVVPIPRLFFKQYEIIGSTLGSYEEFEYVTKLVGEGLDVIVDGVHPISEYPVALERLRAGRQLGKLVMMHDQG
jgi:NADPH:quinone reductase-like Zn-dependent oxidoreductase